MSRFRGSPSRSPFRSPPRLYQAERQAIIQDEHRYKSAVRAQSDLRRVSEQLALLQVKVRHTNELEDKVESLIRQNNQLSRDNDELARQLSEKRYELQRLRIVSSQHHQRQSIRNGQLFETNKAFQLEIDLLKKQRAEANRIYQSNILKLERLLDQKVAERDSLSLKCSGLSKELQLTVIKFQEQKNRLKNIMARTQHQLQRQIEYTKQKQTCQKFSQIDLLKRNYTAQITLLEDEISKLKLLNQSKTQDFQIQLNQNKTLRKKHDEQVRLLGVENDDLRTRMLKLQQINRSEVENIQVKYNNYHSQGTNNLKQHHSGQIKLLLDEIDKLKWLLAEKNIQIQNLVQDKRQIRKNLDEKQLQLGSEIDSLKNQKYSQAEKFNQESHEQMARINELINKSLRDSESYHERILSFKNKISKLESQLNDKQILLENHKNKSQAKIKELNNTINQITYNLQKTKRQLADSEDEKLRAQNRHKQYQQKTQDQIKQLSSKLGQTEVKLEEVSDKLKRQAEDNKGNDGLKNIQIQSLRQNISVLQKKLYDEQRNHAQQLNQISNNTKEKLKKIQDTQRRALQDIQNGFNQQFQAQNLRLQKLARQKGQAQNELKKYISMYTDLQKYFKSPHEGSLFELKSKDSIYKVLEKVNKSSIHIF